MGYVVVEAGGEHFLDAPDSGVVVCVVEGFVAAVGFVEVEFAFCGVVEVVGYGEGDEVGGA